MRKNIWNDEKFPFLSDDVKLVYFHLLTTPFKTPFGLFKASPGALADEMRWDRERYVSALREAMEHGIIDYDERLYVAFVPELLEKNWPISVNQVKSWKKQLDELPESPLKEKFLALLKALAEAKNNGINRAIKKVFQLARLSPSKTANTSPTTNSKSKNAITPESNGPGCSKSESCDEEYYYVSNNILFNILSKNNIYNKLLVEYVANKSKVRDKRESIYIISSWKLLPEVEILTTSPFDCFNNPSTPLTGSSPSPSRTTISQPQNNKLQKNNNAQKASTSEKSSEKTTNSSGKSSRSSSLKKITTEESKTEKKENVEKENKQSQQSKKNKNKRKPRKFEEDSIEYQLAKLLLDKIKEHRPNVKKPDLQSWAKNIDLMLRIDKRSPEEIREVIKWCQKDSFWQSNILSTKKLREKFDQLAIKMKKQKKTLNIQKEQKDENEQKFVEQVVSLYHKILTELPLVRVVGPKVYSLVGNIKRKYKNFNSITEWENFFQDVKKQDFLLGENDKEWRANFYWLLSEDNFEKVINNSFCSSNNESTVSPPPIKEEVIIDDKTKLELVENSLKKVKELKQKLHKSFTQKRLKSCNFNKRLKELEKQKAMLLGKQVNLDNKDLVLLSDNPKFSHSEKQKVIQNFLKTQKNSDKLIPGIVPDQLSQSKGIGEKLGQG